MRSEYLLKIQQDDSSAHCACKTVRLLHREKPDLNPLDMCLWTAQTSTQLTIRYRRPCRSVFTRHPHIPQHWWAETVADSVRVNPDQKIIN